MKSLLAILALVAATSTFAFGQPDPIPQEDVDETPILKEKLAESLKNATGSKAIFMGESSAALGYLDKNNELSNLSYNKLVEGYKSAVQSEKVFDEVLARIMGEVYLRRAAAELHFRQTEEQQAKEKGTPLEPSMPSLAEKQTNITDQALIRLNALSVAQNQKIIQQNQRIITLLEQLADKK